jgi:hypothetical protein
MIDLPPPDPAQPPRWSSDYFRDSQPSTRLARGLVGHVRIVAILLIVQGVFEMLFALFGICFALLTLFVPQEDFVNMRPLGIALGVISVAALVCGGLRLAAGIANLRFRRRLLGITALGAGMLTMLTGYCAPTAIALAVYGLIVYLNDSVVAAFEMGDAGRTTTEISAAFPPDG